MKRCKHCQSEIELRAKICPHCRKSQTSSVFRVLTAVFLILLIFSINTYSYLTNDDDSNREDTSKYITLQEFNQIENDMSYEDIKTIIGSDGTISSQTNLEEYEMIIYYWYGEDNISNANFTFQNGKLVSKAQIGLK